MDHARAVVEQTPGAPSSTTSLPDEGPACLSCRQRKLKCSRDHPTCTQCVRLSHDCIYDPKKQKPGLKTGAVEGLNRRLETVERTLEMLVNERNATKSTPLNISSQEPSSAPRPGSHDILNPYTPDQNGDSSKKRKRPTFQSPQIDFDQETFGLLPRQAVIDAAITGYFATVHHWVPMLHQTRFRSRLNDQIQHPYLAILLHAIVAITLRHIEPEELGLSAHDVNEQVQKSTNAVMASAISDLSVENTQALIMICFDKMGAGLWHQAWSIIGCLTRTVDYLQLSVEPDDDGRQRLLAPLTLLEEPHNFAETEERRRVFWNIFLLDRLSSVTCGWTTGLTSDNVSRQLPCNGGLWARGEKADTPYFGLWDKSQAKMGKSVAYLPTKMAGKQGETERRGSDTIDTSNLGAVAYRIEATESLSQVSTFFLQQRVDFTNRSELAKWLTRFKELDLRLVHWKLFLPQEWKDSNVSKTADVKMDPNLTLAHITHNTSMILLHQHIAYAPAALSRAVNLPSSCSAETCRLAAVEIASIVAKYLHYTREMMVGAEFVFCAFVAAKVLLVHALIYRSELTRDFFDLVEHLREMSRRWQGLSTSRTPQRQAPPTRPLDLDLAGQYAVRLEEFHEMCAEDSNHVAYILFCSGANGLLRSAPLNMSQRSRQRTKSYSGNSAVSHDNHAAQLGAVHPQQYVDPHHSIRSVGVTGASPPGAYFASSGIAAGGVQLPPVQQPGSMPPPGQLTPINDINASPTAYMSGMFWDPSFTDLDRVIISTEADFTFNEPYGL